MRLRGGGSELESLVGSKDELASETGTGHLDHHPAKGRSFQKRENPFPL